MYVHMHFKLSLLKLVVNARYHVLFFYRVLVSFGYCHCSTSTACHSHYPYSYLMHLQVIFNAYMYVIISAYICIQEVNVIISTLNGHAFLICCMSTQFRHATESLHHKES